MHLKGPEEEFYRELFCYIESGIPIVAAMNSKNHSIAVIGHGELNLDLLDGMHGFVDASVDAGHFCKLCLSEFLFFSLGNNGVCHFGNG